VSFAAITLCVASQCVFVVVYFVIDSVRKLLDTPSYYIITLCLPSGCYAEENAIQIFEVVNFLLLFEFQFQIFIYLTGLEISQISGLKRFQRQ
jgi:hypothetical protein